MPSEDPERNFSLAGAAERRGKKYHKHFLIIFHAAAHHVFPQRRLFLPPRVRRIRNFSLEIFIQTNGLRPKVQSSLHRIFLAAHHINEYCRQNQLPVNTHRIKSGKKSRRKSTNLLNIIIQFKNVSEWVRREPATNKRNRNNDRKKSSAQKDYF